MINKKLGLMALLAGYAVSGTMAGNFNNYATGDVLLCFRNGGVANLVIDVGPIATFTNATPNQRIPIAQFTVDQLNAAFGGVNGLNWSAFTWLNNNTLFVSKARAALNSQSVPWSANNAGLQSGVAQNMSSIPVGANYIFNNAAISPSTADSVIEPQSASGYINGQSYYNSLYGGLSLPNFGGTFPGTPEIATPGDFDTSATVVRSDFYQIPPGAGRAGVKYLGYFEFASDGSLTYVAYPATTPTVPVIKSISRSGNVSTISYTAGSSGVYTLRGTNTLASGVAATNWPAISILTSGDTAVHTATDTDSGDIKFYIITAQ
ncbi:MAG: hypothetical protein WDN00_06390 [Limisphaerales bacterium]